MKILTYITTTVLFLTVFPEIKSQTTQPYTIGNGSLENQFNYVIYRADKVENDRVVRGWWLYTLKKQVSDTVDFLHNRIDGLNDSITLLGNNIEAINQSNSELKTTIDNLNNQKDSIDVFGISIKKTLYNSILWSVIAVLAILLIFVFALYKRSHSVTKEAKNDLTGLKSEFESFRKRALEREREVVRKLYDEVLKYKNMVGSE